MIRNRIAPLLAPDSYRITFGQRDAVPGVFPNLKRDVGLRENNGREKR